MGDQPRRTARVWGVALTVLTVFGTLIAIPNDIFGLHQMFTGDGEEAAPPVHTTTTAPVAPPPPATGATEAIVPTTTEVAPPFAADTFDPPVAAADPPPTRGGPLVLRIEMGSGGKVGPAEYRAGATPGANVDVFDDVGQLSADCYPSWVLTREGAEVRKTRNSRCTSGGITMFNFGDSLDQPGAYRLAVSVVTDGGQTGSTSVDFQVS